MPRIFRFEVPGRGVGKESVRIERGRARIPNKSRDFMATVALYAQVAGVIPLERCRVDVHICLPVRVKKYKTRPDLELEPLVRPDEDNVRKAVKDALEGVAYVNDKHVMWGETGYRIIDAGKMPCTRVIITECHWTDYRERGDESNG